MASGCLKAFLSLASQAPNSGLCGPDPKDIALINQSIHLAESATLLPILRHAIPYNKPLHTFDAHLKTGTFRVGDRITLADIVLAAYIQRALPYSLDAEFRVKIPNIIRHFETIVNQPKLKDVFGSYEYVEKIQAKAAARAYSKAEKKKLKEEKDEEEEEEPEWKRVYSNRDTRGAGGALECFYQNYDPAGFSVWRVDFKYNEELIQTFMSSNQIGGLFNRLEASRKYLFGSVGVLGEMKNSVISGALILRGLEVGPSDKWFFEAALAWDLEVDGKKWVDGNSLALPENEAIVAEIEREKEEVEAERKRSRLSATAAGQAAMSLRAGDAGGTSGQ
ncbi:hypothetical protein M378DRAFT_7430 [Amanita muscaria Koide BX008]|uniref:Elongation factor 1-gamma n=1 Tax=Amanita muscaria (strain Koide BX008) TaxID=946122 RepID=A0A0C2TQQ4_AMAMK|nr:hypothetical protein M378DRAFT_7430 [Amanita muscaria Koide BX008]